MSQPENYTVREAAEILRISARTVYRLIEANQLEGVRVGKQWRIPRRALQIGLGPQASGGARSDGRPE